MIADASFSATIAHDSVVSGDVASIDAADDEIYYVESAFVDQPETSKGTAEDQRVRLELRMSSGKRVITDELVNTSGSVPTTVTLGYYVHGGQSLVLNEYEDSSGGADSTVDVNVRRLM